MFFFPEIAAEFLYNHQKCMTAKNILTKLNILFKEKCQISVEMRNAKLMTRKVKSMENQIKLIKSLRDLLLSGRPNITINDIFYFYGHKVDCKLRSHAPNKLSGPPCEN